MDNIYNYIKADHDKVNNLFKQFEEAPSVIAKNDYVEMIINEILIHMEVEEKTFYKELLKRHKAEDEVHHGEEEHREISAKIDEILAMPNLDKDWEDKVLELKKLVDHHVSEEEGSIFRKAKKVLDDNEAYVIREQMHDLKEKILTRNDEFEPENQT